MFWCYGAFEYLLCDKGLGIMMSLVLLLLLMHVNQSSLIVCNVCVLHCGGAWVEVSARARSIPNCDFCDCPQFLEAVARFV
jgi:hypothetical protein